MKVILAVVGKVGKSFAEAVEDYETRARRYWPLEVVEVKASKGGGGKSEADVRAAEAEALIERIPREIEIVALTRVGERWSSEHLCSHLQQHALRSSAGVAFVIGGANGLGEELVRRAQHRMSISSMTLPHEMVRLIVAEQLYRAGTIARGEPYHKGR